MSSTATQDPAGADTIVIQQRASRPADSSSGAVDAIGTKAKVTQASTTAIRHA